MTTGHVFMAMSLDGFVARKDHALDWLMKQNTAGEDHGFEDFEASIDGLIMGRGSFKNMLTLGEWPYKKPVIVMSGSLTQSDVPTELQDKVRIQDIAPNVLMASLEKEGWHRAYIDGGEIVQSFIRNGLVEDLTITLIPILIGEGRRLFGKVGNDIDLKLTGSKFFESGLVQNCYKVL